MESAAGDASTAGNNESRKHYKPAARAVMPFRLFLVLAAALLVLRVPSVVQPMGADQGLYAYAGERILAGGLPYRDAWGQKPPAIHYTYALMRAVWPGDGAVGAADLLAAAAVAWLLYRLGAVTGSSTAGAVSA